MVFRFKQFSVCQERTPMKVGTDGVLAGAWARVLPSDRRMLDIGTGTGLIALMLAQRAPAAHITGIDICDISEACANAAASPWAARLVMQRVAVQDFDPGERFDLVVSNPPFFTESLLCPDPGRTAARHAVGLSYADLAAAAARMLAPGGRFALILPAWEADRFTALCAGRLRPVRRTDVRTLPDKPPRRALLEFAAPAGTPAASAAPAGTPAASAVSAPASRPAFPASSSDPAAPAAPAGTPAASAVSAPASRPAFPASSSDPAAPAGTPAASAVSAPASRPASPASPSDPAGTKAAPAASAEPSAAPGFPLLRDELIVSTGAPGCYTDAYRALTRDFYLKF